MKSLLGIILFLLGIILALAPAWIMMQLIGKHDVKINWSVMIPLIAWLFLSVIMALSGLKMMKGKSK